MRIAVVGASGMVGRQMLVGLRERSFRCDELVLFGGERSAGATIAFGDHQLVVQSLTKDACRGFDLALFSAGSGPAKEWAPVFAREGLVVDNSSAFRMDHDVPLCVPEVNLDAARRPARNIVANPNCSTIQMVVAINPLHQAAGLMRVIVSTYQAISGSGASAVDRFLAEPSPAIATLTTGLSGNLLMEWKRDDATGMQEEELKIVSETRKILALPKLPVSANCVRVPVVTGHSEAVLIETQTKLTADVACEILNHAPGIRLMNDGYPTPLHVAGRDEVFVGRVREDLGSTNGLQLWVVADNLRKGAATNALQIAELLLL